jgi:hypothetical protein
VEQSDVFRLFVEAAERLGIAYFVTGSMASIVHGEPRLTLDLDVVVELRPEQVRAFCAAFPEPAFYCPVAAARDAVLRRFQFNIVHPDSGFKIDVILLGDSVFDRGRFGRRVRRPTGLGFDAWFASAEDVIVKKLQYFNEGGSDKHIRDIVGILKVQGPALDRDYVAGWAARLNLTSIWEDCLKHSPPETP